MLSLLNPFLLWFAPLLAAPLMIHFLGRAEPRPRDFPSLLPVKGVLTRAMQRHRLKNWLQLILRTLALLCLLLAAAGPVWRGSGFAPPESAALLLHNGAYAAAPRFEGGTRTSWLDAQRDLARALDSLAPGQATVERVLPQSTGGAAARFGDWPGAAARLLRAAPGRAAHVFLPVFDPRDLEALAPSLKAWLETYPERRAVLLDYSEAREGLEAFGEVRAHVRGDALVLSVAMPSPTRKPPLWKNSENLQSAGRETRARDGRAEIELPLPVSGWVRGAFVLDDADRERFAESAWSVPVAVRVPGPARLCHVSERAGGASLASLGAEGPRRRIVSARADEGLGPEPCTALYLAGVTSGPLLARAASVLRAGGKVIIGAGDGLDVALLNRNLLAPLNIGRFTASTETFAQGAAATANPRALARLGARAERWGEPGIVRRRLDFVPAEGGAVLLKAPGPLVVHHRAGRGEILVWTLDLDDLAWSDLGSSPWPALMHAAFLGGGADAVDMESGALDSDSSRFFAGADANAGPEPALAPWWRPEAGGGRAGPFDRTGLYAVPASDGSGDSAWLAVRLARAPLAPAPRDAWNRFEEALGTAARARVARLEFGDDWRDLYGGFRLRSLLLVLAALLLFAEGAVSLRLSPLRNLGNRN